MLGEHILHFNNHQIKIHWNGYRRNFRGGNFDKSSGSVMVWPWSGTHEETKKNRMYEESERIIEKGKRK